MKTETEINKLKIGDRFIFVGLGWDKLPRVYLGKGIKPRTSRFQTEGKTTNHYVNDSFVIQKCK